MEKRVHSVAFALGLAVDGELAGTRIRPVATYSAMWFAWAVFHRGTEIYQP